MTVWDSLSDGSIALLCGREIEIECPSYTAAQPQISMDGSESRMTWVIKTVHKCFHFLQLVLINSFKFTTIDYCVDRNFLFNMLHSQLSIIFVLATGAIAPVIGLPVPSGKGPGQHSLDIRNANM